MREESLRGRLQAVQVLLDASRDPEALVRLIVSAATRADAQRAIAERFHCSPSIAAAVLESRFSSLLTEETTRLMLEARDLEDRLTG
jgi:DNA gyrase/topoisomerase IV subunit A